MAVAQPPQPLPWERGHDDPPSGAGICLSGGGLRAAAFGLGVLQVLQERRRLLFGPNPADHLSAVSGGSYTAAAFMLEAARQASSPDSGGLPPLAHGSPEEAHILGHGSYFGSPKALAKIGFLLVLNVASLIVLLAWVGWFVAVMAWLGARLHEVVPGLDAALRDLPPTVHVIAVIVALSFLVVGLYSDGWLRRYGFRIFGLSLLIVTSSYALDWGETHGAWWTASALVLEVVGAIVIVGLVAGATYLARRAGFSGRIAQTLNGLTIWVPRLGLLVVMAWLVVWWDRGFRPILDEREVSDPAPVGLAFFATLILGAIFSYLTSPALHRTYRDLVGSCFAVRRSGANPSVIEPAPPTRLSTLAPPGGLRSFPRLLAMGTANVRLKHTDGEWRSYGGFAFSHDACGIPGQPGASFATDKLELLDEPAGELTLNKEPLISLMTAVATAGAAVSPSMGRHTIPSAGMVLTLINLRPGRWVPNPFSSYARRKVSERTTRGPLDNDQGMGPGFNDLIPELVGLTGKRVYISDGGHDDNLGLLALLRAKSSEIWCVDSSAEPNGRAAELRRVLAEATTQLGLKAVELDVDVFAARSDGLFGDTYAIGRVVYSDDTVARLVVIKLGLCDRSDPALLAMPRMPGGWPHHPTTKQVYDQARMDAYRRIGADSAARAEAAAR